VGQRSSKKFIYKHVIIFGLGGVGSFAAEALARSGVGKLTIVDFDIVSESNINRQLIATLPNVGKSKVELMKKRIEDIYPHIQVTCINGFLYRKTGRDYFFREIDFVIDAIDTLKYKVDLITSCKNKNIPIISSMGAGNRLDPSRLFIADISEIKAGKCPFVKSVKYKLRCKGIIEGLPVVFSDEKPFAQEKKKGSITIETENGSIELNKIHAGKSPFCSTCCWVSDG